MARGEALSEERSTRRLTAILTVVIAILVIPLCGSDRLARSQVTPSRPQAVPATQVFAMTPPGGGQAALRGETDGGRPVLEAPPADRPPLVQRIAEMEVRRMSWMAFLGLVVVVGGALLLWLLRAQHRRIRSLETKLNTLEIGLTTKIVTLEEHLRRESEHGRPRERI